MACFSDLKVGKTLFEKLPQRLKYNKVISGYYEDLYNELSLELGPYDDKFLKSADRVKSCSLLWDVLHFKKNRIKMLEGANLCHDRFCPNCQSALALKRYKTFFPVFKDMSDRGYNVYHCIFTVKNCSGSLLRNTIDRMFKSMSVLVQYFDGRKKIKGLDFSYLLFFAGIRALEVTYNKEEDTYHPHLHCLFSLEKDAFKDKVCETVFSYSYKHNDVKLFSEEEVLLQKIWYLLNVGKKVTLKNIDSLDVGYSVVCNKATPSDYKEVFKYAFKNDLNGDDCFDYERFKVYRKNLNRLRFIQGYGACQKYDFENETLSDEELDFIYNDFRAELFGQEEPDLLHEPVEVLLENLESGPDDYVTSGSVKAYVLQDGSAEALEEFKKKVK
jgi:plasmid rolling circle replication initiator protein Rep